MSGPYTVTAARRAFYVVLALRWLPTGFLIPIMVLLATSRGLTLAEVGAAWAVQGVVVMLLELPTGGIADAFGRRPVLVASSVLALAAMAVLFVADSLPTFVLAAGLMGVYRALDSGPLEAWYVDVALAADPRRDLEADLSGAGTALYLAVGAGSLGAGLVGQLVGFAGPIDPLAAAVAAAIAVEAVHLLAILGLVREVRPRRGLQAARAAVTGAPAVVAGAMRLAARDRGLALLLSVELLWGVGLTAVELLWQPRTAFLLGGVGDDTLVFGLMGAAGWVLGAAGAALLPPLLRLLGGSTPRTAALLRVSQGLAVVGLALAGGVAALGSAYVVFYVIHGASNPAHFALLHRRVDSAHRTTVLSANSLVSMAAGALGGNLLLARYAQSAGIPAAWLVAAALLAAAAPLYLLAGRTAPRAGTGRAQAGTGHSTVRTRSAEPPTSTVPSGPGRA